MLYKIKLMMKSGYAHFRFGPRIVIQPEQVFYQNEHVVGFVNLRPYIRGHVLVCPRRENVPSVSVLEPQELF